jgi:hypothetical protein
MNWLIIKTNEDKIITQREDIFELDKNPGFSIVKTVTPEELSEFEKNRVTPIDGFICRKNDLLRCTPMAAISYMSKNGSYGGTLDPYMGMYNIVLEDFIPNGSRNSRIKLYKDLPFDMFEKVTPPKDFDSFEFITLLDVLYKMLSTPNNVYNNLSVVTEKGMIKTYLDNGKVVSIKPGRFLAQHTTDPEKIERFSNLIKSTILKPTFEILKGKDILTAYNVESYLNQNDGYLGGSCMKYGYMQGRLFFYTDTPNISCLVAKIDNKIVGRAILWETNEYKFMDRIYTTTDSQVELFLKWAETNKYITKSKQSRYKDDAPELEFKLDFLNIPEFKEFNLYPHLKRINDFSVKDDSILPYMDSFKYMGYNEKTNTYYLSTRNNNDEFVCFENSGTKCGTLENNPIYIFKNTYKKYFADTKEALLLKLKEEEILAKYKAQALELLKDAVYVNNHNSGVLRKINSNDICILTNDSRLYLSTQTYNMYLTEKINLVKYEPVKWTFNKIIKDNQYELNLV